MSIVGTAGRPVPAASDIDLVHASREGDDGAFEELYRRYHGRISAFVRGYVRDDGRAEDVIQDAFVCALRRMRLTDCEIQFKPWIYEIARNKAIDAHRRASRSPEVSFELDGELDAPGGLRPAAPYAPEASLMDRERFDHFRGALDELSDTHHRIILLRELEGLSYREIGARMQLSSTAVESTLFRARRKLEHEYEQLDTGRRCRLVRASIARLAEGIDSAPDRRRFDRHAPRCWSCRRRAHELGLHSSTQQRKGLRGVGALLPLPGFLRRFLGGHPQGAGSGHAAARDAVGVLGAPGWESAAQGAQKAVAVVASAIAVGGGGATLGGVGPLAVDGDRHAKQGAPEDRGHTRRGGARQRPGGEAAGDRRTSGASRRADQRSHHRHRQRREGASPGAGAGRGSAPAKTGAGPSSSRGALPKIDAGGLVPSLPRRPSAVLPEGGSAPLGGGETLPEAPDLPAVPLDLKPAVGQVQGLAPDLPVEAPKLGSALPEP